jgi:hypothetical protein
MIRPLAESEFPKPLLSVFEDVEARDLKRLLAHGPVADG